MTHNNNMFYYGLSGIWRWLCTQYLGLGSIFEACDDLLQTGDAYSAEEKKHRARTVVRIVLAYVVGVRQLFENAISSSGFLLCS